MLKSVIIQKTRNFEHCIMRNPITILEAGSGFPMSHITTSSPITSVFFNVQLKCCPCEQRDTDKSIEMTCDYY